MSIDKFSVIIVPEGWSSFQMAELRHPRTNSGHLFAFNEDGTDVKEVVSVNEPFGAWFIGNTVESDGRLQMMADTDPLLLAIPYLRKAEKCVPLDHLISDDDFPQADKLVDLLSRDRMERIANSKGASDLNVWLWNEEKCLAYLKTKVDKLIEEIEKSGLAYCDNTTSSNYIASKRKELSTDESESKRCAWQFVSDFLEDDISKKLASHMNIDLGEKPSEAKPAKKAKTDKNSNGPKDDFSLEYKSSGSKLSSESPASTKQKALAKSAVGSKSITSFFSKK